MGKGQTKNTLAIFLISIIIFIGVIVVIDININESSSITGDVVKTLKNCEMVEIPYTSIEEYSYYPKAEVIESYAEEKIEMFGKGIYQEGVVSLKNVDDEAGWFNVIFLWETLRDNQEDTIRHYINPDETVEFISLYDISLGEDTQFKYNYKSEPITKTRTVTKYRTEEKCN